MTGAGGQISGHGSARGRRRFPLHDDSVREWMETRSSLCTRGVDDVHCMRDATANFRLKGNR